MRKIKDNGRTLVLAFNPFNNCKRCYFNALKCPKEKCFISNEWVYIPLHWRETLPSKLSRLIKRMVRK